MIFSVNEIEHDLMEEVSHFASSFRVTLILNILKRQIPARRACHKLCRALCIQTIPLCSATGDEKYKETAF